MFDTWSWYSDCVSEQGSISTTDVVHSSHCGLTSFSWHIDTIQFRVLETVIVWAAITVVTDVCQHVKEADARMKYMFPMVPESIAKSNVQALRSHPGLPPVGVLV